MKVNQQSSFRFGWSRPSELDDHVLGLGELDDTDLQLIRQIAKSRESLGVMFPFGSDEGREELRRAYFDNACFGGVVDFRGPFELPAFALVMRQKRDLLFTAMISVARDW